MPVSVPYDRRAAVRYAHRWAYGRNPRFYDYEEIGGDCTNFASQCLFAGSGVMNYTPTYGWYYISADEKAPAWTGVEYFYNFLTRDERTQGPVGREASMDELLPGDFVQLRLREDAEHFGHTPIVVAVGRPATPESILVAAHSYDTDLRPLSTYPYQQLRCLHILGTYLPDGLTIRPLRPAEAVRPSFSVRV